MWNLTLQNQENRILLKRHHRHIYCVWQGNTYKNKKEGELKYSTARTSPHHMLNTSSMVTSKSTCKQMLLWILMSLKAVFSSILLSAWNKRGCVSVCWPWQSEVVYVTESQRMTSPLWKGNKPGSSMKVYRRGQHQWNNWWLSHWSSLHMQDARWDYNYKANN